MFSMTTMASSTTRPVATTNARRVRILIEKPAAQMAARVPMRETGNGDRRGDDGAERAQEGEDDQNDDGVRQQEAGDHLLHRFTDERRIVAT